MAYTAVGSLAATSGSGTNVSSLTLAVSPTAIGDVLVLFAGDCGYHNTLHPAYSTNDTPVSGVSGGGVTTWNKLVGNGVGTNDGTDSEIWWGVITATGAQTISVNWSAPNSYQALVAQQFHSSTAGTWTAGSVTLSTTVAETLTSFTAITAPLAGQLYLGAQANLSINETITLTGGMAGEYPGGGTSGSVIYAYNLSPGTSAQTPSWPSGSGEPTYTDAQVAGFLYTAAPSSPTRPRVYSQAVQRAANWMKRESGLLSPESGLIPRAA